MWRQQYRLLCLLLLGLIFGACAMEQKIAQPLKASSACDIRAEPLAVQQEFMNAYARGNAQALSELFAEDASFTGTVSAVWHQGQTAIQTNYEKLFQAFPKSRIVFQDSVFWLYNQPLQTPSWTLLWLLTQGFSTCSWRMVRRTPPYPWQVQCHTVKRNGRWLIINFHSSRLLPPKGFHRRKRERHVSIRCTDNAPNTHTPRRALHARACTEARFNNQCRVGGSLGSF